MKTYFLAFALLMSMTGWAQSSAFDISKDEENGSVVYKGAISFDDLETEPSFTWLQEKADSYTPRNKEAVQVLKDELAGYDMVVLMGTWCEDSQILVPQLYKLLQMIDYPMNQYFMYGVDRAKTSKNDEHKTYNVDRVPTIIIYKGKEEVGRITEMVNKSLEGDLAAIISKEEE